MMYLSGGNETYTRSGPIVDQIDTNRSTCTLFVALFIWKQINKLIFK